MIMMMYHAHTNPRFPSARDAENHWDPLVTPLGSADAKWAEERCRNREGFQPGHGHLITKFFGDLAEIPGGGRAWPTFVEETGERPVFVPLHRWRAIVAARERGESS